jgi:hypothetical protein
MPVAQLVMLVKDNTPVGIEMLWETSVTHAADACTTLNMARTALNDAAWVVRQVERTNTHKSKDDEGLETTVQ